MSFFSTLNYSSCNEDWRTEAAALRIQPGDRVVCVTGSGDRPLNLLVQNPEHLLAVDANPTQTHLLELKMAALKTLSYGQYTEFLGLGGESRTRLGHWPRVRSVLSERAAGFWERNLTMLRRGVLYQGRWETYHRRLWRLARLVRGRKISRLFEFTDLNAQREFVRTDWDTLVWRWMFRLLCSRSVARVCFRDPAFFRYVDCGMPVGCYIHQRMLCALQRGLARDNFMLSLLFQGRLSPSRLPPYLDPTHFETIRSRVDRIEPRTADLLELLECAPAESFDAFSLSDVPSYLNQAAFERLLALVLRTAKARACVCIRFFLTTQAIPARFSAALLRETELEENLAQSDQAFAYRFFVATVARNEP